MKLKSILIILVTIVGIVVIYYSFVGDADESAYRDEIKKEREEKDTFMKNSNESPFADQRDAFTGLKYFDADPKFKVVATLTPIERKNPILLATSDGKEEHYIEYAHAEFDLNGFHNSLLILEGIGMGPVKGKLFLAFSDETSAKETYGAGRYLDVAKVPGSKTILLDFNKAYNPYCAYSDKFSCPFPPKENILQIAVKAGEKTYH